jgi:hypothetical protein
METTNNKLREKEYNFFYRLKNDLDTKIYFYGSIQRSDYIAGESDIDVDIFTNDEQGMMVKLGHYLKKDKSKFKKIVWRLRDNRLVIGYKIMYHDKDGFNVEFSIYNERYKEEILREHKQKMKINILATFILYILKGIYYKLRIINQPTYAYIKKKVLSFGANVGDDDFIVIR